MDISVHGSVPQTPFEAARSRLEPAHDIVKPIEIRIGPDPDQRTWTGHYQDHHVLTLSERTATSAMATELAIHEFAHMRRAEEEHPSHTLDTEEALFLAFAGREVPSEVIPHAFQIANHVRDIYADDITLAVSSGEKLAAFLESAVAGAILDHPREGPAGGYNLSGTTDPMLSVVNAAFALALLDRNDVAADHRLDDLAHAVARDAPGVDLEWFREQFRTLDPEPSDSTCLRTVVDTIGAYFDARAGGAARAE